MPMTNVPTAQLFLADQRGLIQTGNVRRYHTFNADGYVAEGREAFGSLFLFSDDALRPGASLTLTAGQNMLLWLLPVVGGLEYECGKQTGFLEPGQAGQLTLPVGTSYTLSNPYEAETINLLQIGLTGPANIPDFAQFKFNLKAKNTLLPLLGEQSSCEAFIGQYGGREEGVLDVGEHGGDYFVFVLSGAFEVANRLMHGRDGLALHYEGAAELDFEALSNEAILLIVKASGFCRPLTKL